MISRSIGGKNRWNRFFPPIDLEIIELASIIMQILSLPPTAAEKRFNTYKGQR
jgi:hypothetical protein